jgi:prepilin peptidase CpaA
MLGCFTLALASWAGWLDWRSRRIPNWLTVPALLFGLGFHALTEGWPGAKDALVGAGLGLGLLLPLVLARGLGAGDWKLMGALGAFLGRDQFIAVLLGTVLVAGIMAVTEMLRRKRVIETLKNLWVLFLILVTFGHRGARGQITLDNRGLMALPFGVAAAVSTFGFYAIVVGLAVYRVVGHI